MTEWKEYTGSDEQIKEMMGTQYGVLLRLLDNKEIIIKRGELLFNVREFLSKVSEYLICNPQPNADMICQQARTGQEVYIKVKPGVGAYIPPSRYLTTDVLGVFVTTKPDWNIPGAKYSFTEFKD